MSETPVPTKRRSDWCAVLFALLFPTLGTWIYFVALRHSPAGLQHFAYVAEKVIQFGFPVVWVLWIRRQWPKWKGGGLRGVGLGLAFGLLVSAAMLALYHLWLLPGGYLAEAIPAVAEKVGGFGIATPARFALFAAFCCVVHSLLEEYYWRWFVFGQLDRLIPAAWAIAVSSLGFMAHHVLVIGLYFGWLSPTTWCFSFCVAIGGAFWAWLYHRSGSLLGPWLSHLLVDVGVFVVGYQMIAGLIGP